MSFKDIYDKVEELKMYGIDELIELLNIKTIIVDDLEKNAIYINYFQYYTIIISKEVDRCVLLHEIGHCVLDKGGYLNNQRMAENNANTFMCLMLLKNDIWNCNYFDTYLINQGVSPKVARKFNDSVMQRKIQIKYDLSY